MNTTVLEKFLNRKGQICTLTYKRPVKVKKQYQHLNIIKRVTIQCRCGVNYDAIKKVIEKRYSGELPAENQGLPWGRWKIPNYVIEHNGRNYLRFSTIKTNIPTRKTYLVDDKEVKEEEIAEMFLSSEKRKENLDVFTINEDYIEELK